VADVEMSIASGSGIGFPIVKWDDGGIEGSGRLGAGLREEGEDRWF
jgi:hypothetical protein